MKSLDIKSIFVGILATSLVLSLMSSKISETSNLDFVASPNGIGIFDKNTKNIYIYKVFLNGQLHETPTNTYKVADDGSSVSYVN